MRIRRIRGWLVRMAGLFNKAKRDREFAEELECHLEMHIADNLRAGMTHEEARRQALIKLGGIEQTKERYRQQRGLPMIETLIQDIRYGLRMSLKNPGFTLVAIIALALGIGANSAIFSVINAVLLRPLPFEEPDKLMLLWEKDPQAASKTVSYPNYIDWRDQNRSFEALAAFRVTNFNLTGSGEPERLRGRLTTANLFPLLRVNAALGRTFLPEDDRQGAQPTVVLTYGLWQRRFAGDPGIVGRDILLDERSYTVVGVLPKDFQFLSPVDLFVPFHSWENKYLTSRGFHPGIFVAGRLKPDVTVEAARTNMEAIAANLASQYPETNTQCSINVMSLMESSVGDIGTTLYVLLAAVGFVLLIACANVANLLLARAATRQKEIAIRLAMGATRMRMIRQLLTESVMLSLTGGGIGVMLAFWSLGLLIKLSPGNIPRLSETSIDARVLAFTMGISLLTGLLFGLAPAWQASRPDLNETLKEGGGKQAGGGRHRLLSAMVISEVALALVLLVGAGLLMKSFLLLTNTDPGFNPKNVLTMSVQLPENRYDTPDKIVSYFNLATEKLKALPGVEAVALANGLPFFGVPDMSFFVSDGRAKPETGQTPQGVFYVVSSDYFQAMQIPLIKGRYLNAQDVQGSNPVMVIDENLARQQFPDQDPIGKQITYGAMYTHEIVGVVRHVAQYGLDAEPNLQTRPQFYIPYLQLRDDYFKDINARLTFVIRSVGEPLTLATAVRNEIQAVDKDQPIFNISALETRVGESLSRHRFSMLLLSFFAMLALLLASIGIYGVMSYTVTQRTKEIGVRMALGARPRDVLRLIVVKGLQLAGAGVFLGLIASLALTRVMKSMLFGVSASDPLTFAAITLLLAAVALLACLLPARRAARFDPMIALRFE